MAVALLVVACSPDESAESTTTSSISTTTTSSTSTTTTSPSTTTTTDQGSTSTIPEATTTTPATTTTTSSVPQGDWADLPVIAAAFGALGWWDGEQWIQADELTPIPVSGGETYQIAKLDVDGVTTGGPEELLCPPTVLNPGVVLEDEELLGEWPGPYGVAISAGWQLKPHLVEEFTDDGTYAGIASGLLAARGLVVDDPVVKQAIRVDLEGDGVNEVLVVVEDIVGGFVPVEGDYSLAFLHKIVDGVAQSAILGEAVVLDPELAFLTAFSIGAVADLNGDGKMEMVVATAYFEGLGVEVWEYLDDDIGPLPAITVGCGA